MDLYSGTPYWFLKDGLVNSYRSLDEDLRTEVLILGTGISGALIGYHLIKRGIPVMLIDKRDVASGSTCASTSLLQYEIDTPLTKLIGLIGKKNAYKSYLLCRDAIYKLKKISDALQSDCDFRITQSVYLCSYKKDLERICDEYAQRKRAGIDVEYYSSVELKNKFSLDSHGAIVSNDGGCLNAYRLTHDLLEWICRNGGKVFDKTEAAQIIYKKGHVKVVTTNKNTLKARHLVYAIGYEAQEYLKESYGKLHSTYCVVSEMQKEKPFDFLIWETARPYLYMRVASDNRIIAGGKDVVYYSPGKRDKLLSIKTKQIVHAVKDKFPHLHFRPDYSWAGTFAETKDGLPYIGQHQKHPHSYFSLCYGGNGITFSLIAAEVISDLIAGINHPACALFSFYR